MPELNSHEEVEFPEAVPEALLTQIVLSEGKVPAVPL